MSAGATTTGRHIERGPGLGPGGEGSDENISVYAVANALLRERRLIFLVVALCTGLGLAYGLLSDRLYAATSSFVTQSQGGNAGRLAGLAAQFGVSVDAGGKSESPEFYASLLKSRELLSRAVLSEYALPAAGGRDTVRGTLITLLKLDDQPQARQLPLAVRELSERVDARADLRTGVVNLVTVAASPVLAEAINARLLELLGDFNVATRQSQAQAERKFVEDRLTQAGRELRAAEAALQAFLSRNRQYGDSPQLRFENTRLEREVSLRQQVYESLARSLEEARIEEVRNTPVVTVVDRPQGSAERTGLGRASAAIIGLFLGVLLSLTIAVIRQYLRRRERVEERAYEEFVELRGALADTVLPTRWFRSRPPRHQRTG